MLGIRGGGGLKLALAAAVVGVVILSVGAGIAKGSEEVLISGGLGGRGLDAPKTSAADAPPPPEVREDK